MESWWTFGEHGGYYGAELGLHDVTCPFFLEKGNFKVVFHAEKKKPNDGKKLNFDTLECGNCKGYVMALWSTGTLHCSTSSPRHDRRVLPWPLKLETWPKGWPDSVGRYWVQAKRSLGQENWDAAVVMARSALQAALRDQKATGSNLKQEIDDLAAKGLLPPLMKDWAHNLRELGNESAHPSQLSDVPDPRDAADIVYFLDFLLEYLYDLPKRIKDYKERP